LILINSSEVM